MSKSNDVKTILMVGDTISGNIHIPTIETATNADVKLVKAYSATFEEKETPGCHAPKFPLKNFNDVIDKELRTSTVDALIVQAGAVDITNLKTESANSKEMLEYFKQKTVASAHNIVESISNAANKHPEVKNIVVMKQIPRYDSYSSNPPGLKPYLSKIFNETLDELLSCSKHKNKIHIGNHNLDCSGGVLEARYRDIQSKKFDGIHMYGPSGMKAYTDSVLRILSSAQLVKKTPP